MRPLFSSFSLLFFSSLFFFNQVFAESSSEYVEEIHEDIVLVVRAKQGIYEENPEEFIKAISLALQPLVDFKRISRNVMGRYCLLYTSPSPRDKRQARMPSSA